MYKRSAIAPENTFVFPASVAPCFFLDEVTSSDAVVAPSAAEAADMAIRAAKTPTLLPPPPPPL